MGFFDKKDKRMSAAEKALKEAQAARSRTTKKKATVKKKEAKK